MERKELQAKTNTQLQTLLAHKREQLRSLRFKVAANQHKNVRELRVTRQDIAQILTRLSHLRHASSKEASKAAPTSKAKIQTE